MQTRGTWNAATYLLRKLFPVHRGLKAVPKVNVQDLPTVQQRMRCPKVLSNN